MNFTRRQVMQMVVAGPLFASAAHAKDDNSLTSSRDDAVVKKWMNTWLDEARKPAGALEVGRFPERMYYLLKPISWTRDPGEPAELLPVNVPVGFLTDFASIPRVFWSLLPPDGTYTYAAVLHDFLYWDQTQAKASADKILLAAMQEFKVPAATANTIYEAVKIAGGSAWRENAKLKGQGESRVLKIYPDDPRTMWAEWKTDPAHFVR